MGSEKKSILLLPDLLGKGYIFKALGQAWLTISCWEWHTGGAGRPTTFEFLDLGVSQLYS